MTGNGNDVRRVLCLDIEGGHGGSSRSLYHSLLYLDRTRAQPEVWCKRAGPIQDRYQALAIPWRVAPGIPKVSPLEHPLKSLYEHACFAGAFHRAAAFREELAQTVNQRFDVVHFNHESLFALARWLRPRTNAAFTMHMRTMIWHPRYFLSRMHGRIIARAIDHLVFITENERDGFAAYIGRSDGAVIYNIAEPPTEVMQPVESILGDGRFKIASLSNFSPERGTDRLIPLAEALTAAGRDGDVLFVVAGDMHLPRSLSGELGQWARRGGDLEGYVRQIGLDHMFLFLGHVAEPERILVSCDALIKPTRESNPWGRDIIEALAAGKPVLSCGTYDRFVEDGVTGILQPEFDAFSLAKAIAHLADNRALCASLGDAGRERVRNLCGGQVRAAELLELWQRASRRVA